LSVAPFAAPALAQEEDAVDPESILATLDVYVVELFSVDLDGDGVPDITDSDGDGVPEIPEGEPGERDITPSDPSFLEPVTGALAEIGLDQVANQGGDSKLLFDCSGMAMSFDDDGNMKDWAVGVGSNDGGGPNGQLVDVFGEGQVGSRAFTKDNPFQVYDRVVYFGRLPSEGEGPLEHNWTISTAGVSLDSGGDPNPNGKNRNAGEVNLGDEVPSVLQPSGIFPVKGELTSENGLACTAEGWVEFAGGNPLLSVGSGVAAAVGGIGLIGLLFNARPATTWKA